MEFGFDQVFQESSDALLFVDEGGEIIQANRRAEELFDYRDSELAGEEIETLVPDELREEHRGYRDEFFENPETRRMGSGLDLEGQKRDGTRFPADISLSPFDTEEGVVVMAAVRDITEEVEAKKALEETRNKFESLFSAAPNPMIISRIGEDEEMVITELNRRAQDALNCCEEDVVGGDLAEVFPEDQRRSVMEKFESIAEGKDMSPFSTVDGERLYLRGVGGDLMPIEVNPAVTEFGEERLLHLIMRDLTEVREREKQLDVMDRILRHNLLNSLNMVTGYAELIEERSSDEVAGYAEGIVEIVQELLDIADEERAIIDVLSRERNRENLDIAEIFSGIGAELGQEFPGAEIEMDLSGGAEVRVLVEVERAMEELVRNALEHSDLETPEVEVSLRAANEEVHVTVADNGPGIPDEEVAVLTEKEEVGPLFHGSGLGLWLVHWIVRKSGGDLEFRENRPRGSVITVRLPRAEEPLDE